MSKVMRAIDAKSFIIGVLTAVIVCMAMGAMTIDSRVFVKAIDFDDDDFSKNKIRGVPFAVANSKIYYYSNSVAE